MAEVGRVRVTAVPDTRTCATGPSVRPRGQCAGVGHEGVPNAPPERRARRRHSWTLVGILAGIEGPRRPCPPASPPLLVAYPIATISPSAELFPRQSPESGPRPSPCAVNWHLRRTVTPGRCHGPKIRDSQWLRCWKPNFVEEARKLGQRDVRTSMIYTHVLNRGGRGVRSRADLLGQLPGGSGRYTETM